jgi:hypothetical protein
MIAYMTKKEEERMMNMDLDDLAPIGDAVIDAANRKRFVPFYPEAEAVFSQRALIPV